ncbi:MAG TPA: threonylcarbamoyl-AMP synthase [Nitrosomonas nitrosa]|jgi:L-threonylcarbamoyladenylate synthase|uniref:Threonylcarbamoyl-AMP synthase n=1 Tax=Nitrosomonas nitrosa TaxID=52442 RepID=A0A1I4U9N1_9PROT|nr:L-threonylcarbamoyladenylate synthase [Nitrosomonas nitrosa]MCO6433446.1 threonylcarbamoyl-AMP synthase [Nitrosomonas nitrosa]PTQ89659.1 translation factor SUA5 [Nitrosomonas nitrosa]SFM85510.1 translation factor SUA5 [Nitrosomonas nitrosa]HBZ29786.1 threonylcarbamoyl-AMP synthase [Nitrosomonas nitrosa]HNP51069.1 L-threonylcarbamoyladenylate synthase [Nitrosomonas nitrosa]
MNKKTTLHLLEENIARAVALLESGKNVAFPTETVYGLGADITNASAISRIFEIKGRPTNHPLIVHIAEIDRLDYWANNVPASAWKLAAHFWPGPLTLILPKSSHVPLTVTGGQNTVGLRVPDHPIALALLKALGANKALAAPSANRFGRLSPTSANHVQQELGDKISMILDGGICKIGLESTIISFCDSIPLLLRPGGIPITAIEEVLNQKIELNKNLKHALATPGTHASHYAPNTRLEVWSTEFIHQRALELSAEGLQVALIIRADSDQLIHIQNDNIYHILMSANPIEYGQQLYATLRMLDEKNFSRILAEAPPDDIPWLAISDRLQRASFKT